ncbi:hypothetical protein AMTRI_Chr07g77360 [Amborella trichopoda]
MEHLGIGVWLEVIRVTLPGCCTLSLSLCLTLSLLLPKNQTCILALYISLFLSLLAPFSFSLLAPCHSSRPLALSASRALSLCSCLTQVTYARSLSLLSASRCSSNFSSLCFSASHPICKGDSNSLQPLSFTTSATGTSGLESTMLIKYSFLM